ncbi:hypothetical protein ACFLUR_01525 [Chloroflexota bacterium]
MADISHENRLEVARLYLLGYTYAEIEKKTVVSHGSISSIVNELLSGQLVIPGVPSDEVSDLHQLSVVLKKKNLEPSQALLGITMFERLTELGIIPSQIDHWSELVKVFAPDDFPAKDFFETALYLHKLEEAAGKPFQEIAQEYTGLQQKVGEMEGELDSLDEKKKGLAGEVESLTSEVGTLEHKKEEVKSSLEAESTDLEQAKSMVAVAKEEHTHVTEEIEDLLKKKDKLHSEVGSKEESLIKLKEIGLSEEDLLHLRKSIEGIAEKDNVNADQIKDEFFSVLEQFGNFLGFKKAIEEEEGKLQSIVKQKSSVVGEIEELENRKATLQAEVENTASGAAKMIHEAGTEAVASIRQEAGLIKEELTSIMEKTLVTGLAVGEAAGLQKQGEKAGKELEDLITEVKHQLEKK